MASVEPQAGMQNPYRYEIEPDVRKIAVLRSNAIGDFIFSLPALEALRHAYPEAEVVLLGQEWHADFLRSRPSPVDRVQVIPPMEGFDFFPDREVDPKEVETFFERMAAEKFDLAIQLHGGGRHSNPFVRRLGARITAGSRSIDAVPLDRWIPYTYYYLEVMRQLEIVSLVGARPISTEPRLEVTALDLKEASKFVPLSDSPLVVMHPSASDPRRRWPAESFAAAGSALASAGARVAIVGGEADREVADEVVDRMVEEAINLCGCTTLGGLAGLLSRADLVISNDSGPLHMAAAVGTPAVGIYWVGNMITCGPSTSRYYRPVISWRLNCPVCSLNCITNDCEHQESFVADVSVEDVVNSAWEMVEFSSEGVRNA